MALYVSPRRRAPKHPRHPLLLLPAAAIFLILLLLNLHTPPAPAALAPLPEERPPHKCPSPSPLYVFLHLHKTAGNSLKVSLFSFAKRNRLRLHHTCHRAARDTPLQAWWFHRTKSPDAYDCNLDALAAMPHPIRNALDFVVGHQYLGVHTLFPRRDVRYFTMLREPLARKVAHFHHFENNATSLARYLIDANRNYMVKRLATASTAGEIAADLRSRFIDVEAFASRAALRAAKRNLADRFFFVGIQERYAESVCVLSRILNVACGRHGRLARRFRLDARRLARVHENVRGRANKALSRLPSAVRAAARSAESADMELYAFAKTLFEERLRLYPECRR